MKLEEAMITVARAEIMRQGQPDRTLTFEEARDIVASAIRGVDGIIVESLTPESPMPDAWETPHTTLQFRGYNLEGIKFHGPYREMTSTRHTTPDADELRELNDALAAKVAEWKARAEKAEAALRAMEEDDRHLCKP